MRNKIHCTSLFLAVVVPVAATTLCLNAEGVTAIIHKTPTGRIINPVGTVAPTPNFAIGVVGTRGSVVVEASGAAFRQTLTVLRAGTLAAQSQLGFLKKKPWGGKALPGISRQSLFQGLAAGPHGVIYAAGGVSNNIMALRLKHGGLKLIRAYPLVFQPFPKNQYPYQYQGKQKIPGKGRDFYPDSVAVGPRGEHVYSAGLLSNSVARINLKTGHVIYANGGAVPFQAILADHGRRLVVSDWGDNGVTVLNARTMKRLGFIRMGEPTGPKNRLPGIHPTALAAIGDSARVWVACANVDILTEINARHLGVIGMAMDRPYPGAPPGSFPDALAVHGRHLFAANAGNDDVAVFDSATGQAQGLIPTGWYPTSLCIYHRALYVACAKGFGSGPDLQHQWIGNSMSGTVQRIALDQLSRKLPSWTRAALHDDGFGPRRRATLAARNVVAAKAIRHRIRYAVFILRENKTFDEEFGDYKRAGKWADPKLDLYNRTELPNLYSMADRFGLFVNFYMDGEVTAQGHQWTTSAEDSDYVQRTWPMYYSGRGIAPAPGWTQNLYKRPAYQPKTGFAGADDPYTDDINLDQLKHYANPWISYPGGMFIFNDLLRHRVSFMDFGEFVSRNQAGQINPAMEKHLGNSFPGWNRFILDTHRAAVVDRFIADHPRHFPHFLYIWLPDDHTAGQTPGMYTPAYYVANNDLATGRIVAALSRTPQWKQMAIFITEDDAQSGVDHIDAHRSFAVVVSPWVKPGKLITQRYSQVNILRTIEAITGVPPMSQWDANAAVMRGIWASHPDFSPFRPQPIRVHVAYNPGKPWPGELQRRAAGKTGHWLSPGWIKAHARKNALTGTPAFTPTRLMVVPGPEQMRQEWIATKGTASYRRVMAYLRRYARRHHQPLTHYVATADDGGGN